MTGDFVSPFYIRVLPESDDGFRGIRLNESVTCDDKKKSMKFRGTKVRHLQRPESLAWIAPGRPNTTNIRNRRFLFRKRG